MTKQIITLSDNAAQRIKEIMANTKEPSIGVRIGVKSGGCAGMSYVMEYAKSSNSNDEVIEDKGVKVLIDPNAVMYLLGTEMDYKKEELSSTFIILSLTSFGKLSATGQFGEVNVISMLTLFVSSTSIL